MGPEKEDVRLHAIVTGRVQGVCYRWYARDTAVDLGVNGWVRNLPDGGVELVAEGNRGKLEKLLAWCQKGPNLAAVREVQVHWEEATGEFDLFSIRH